VPGTTESAASAAGEPPAFDISVAHPARVYDYWLGGKDNFAADRAAGDKVMELRPEIVPSVRANRRFLGRAVRYLTAEAGIRQFLDVGTGLPSANNTHEVAQAIAPDARIVYVDNDPIVLAHARALLTSTPAGMTSYVDADLREAGKILAAAAGTLDFSQPVALLFLMTLQYVPDADDPHALVREYLDALSPGSFLVVSDTIIEGDDEVLAESARRMNQGMGGRATQTRRHPADIARFFADLEVLEPGVVPLDRWRPDPEDATLDQHTATRAAIGRKP
jgi:SAM-dependent methyltransferase